MFPRPLIYRYLAMNVKWLLGREGVVRTKADKMIDEDSNLQHLYPFSETATSQVLLRQCQHWTRACGRPKRLKVAASGTNLGETLQRAVEADETQLPDVLGEAQDQVGRVEVHGRYCEDLLLRVGTDASINEVALAGTCHRNNPTTRLKSLQIAVW